MAEEVGPARVRTGRGALRGTGARTGTTGEGTGETAALTRSLRPALAHRTGALLAVTERSGTLLRLTRSAVARGQLGPGSRARTDLAVLGGRAQPLRGTGRSTGEAGTLAARGGSATTGEETAGGAALLALAALALLRRLLAAVRDLHGQHDQRGRTTGVGGAQLDADAVTQGQPADHEQTHAAGDRDVHGGRRGEPLVDRGQVLGGEADAGVVDLDEHTAVGQRVTGDPDLRLRRGERRGVLQQLGEEVHEVVDDAAGDLGGGHRGQFDALVLLHLGGGGTEYVDQRHGPGPPTAGLLAGEDEEVLAVTAHTGREVVELEEGGQLVRIGLAGLQFGDERELALDEALAAAREVGEHRVDVASQQRLLGGQTDRLAVHVVEGRGHLADLVPGVHTDGLDGGVDVLRVRLGELPDELGQPVLGDAGRGVLEPAQRADHGPRHDECADQRHPEDDEDDRTVEDRVPLRLLTEFAGLALHLTEERLLDGLHGLDLVGALVVPVHVRTGLAAALHAQGAVEHLLGVHVGRGDLGIPVVQRGQELGGAPAGGLVGRLEGPEGRTGLAERVAAERLVVVVQVRLVAVAPGQRPSDDGALDGGVLLRGGEGGQRTRALDHFRVAGGLRHVLRQAQQRGDQLAVPVDRVQTRAVTGVRVLADAGDVAQLRADLTDARVDAVQGGVAGGVADLVGCIKEGGLRAVGALTGLGDLVVGGLHAVRQRAGRLVALLLERVGERGRLLGHLSEQLHVLQLVHVVHGLVDAQTAQGGRRDHGEGEQGDQTRADAPVAQGDAGAGRGETGRLGRGRGLGTAGARRAARRTGALRAVTAVTGRAGILGVLGRGTAVVPAARLLISRGFPSALAGLGRPHAIPLETSLH